MDLNKKMSDLTIFDTMPGYLELAEIGVTTKEELLQKQDDVDAALDGVDTDLRHIQAGLDDYENCGMHQTTSEGYEMVDKWGGTQPELQEQFDKLSEEREMLVGYQKRLEKLVTTYCNFDKGIFFSNLRTLLRETDDVKIGQIEREAGVRLGYTARLEKPNNTAEPSVEFVVTAAKMLGISLDTFLKVDITEMTPTEKYLVKFFDKLKADTLVDKLNWQKETADSLNRMECDENAYVEHPLFSYETFFEEGETDYPNEVSRVVMVSNTYGPTTYIHGDCYNLRLKNGSYIYIMDVEKSVHRTNDPTAQAVEVWMYMPSGGKKFLAGTRDGSVLESVVAALFETVRERTKHPLIQKDFKDVMDAFMQDDFTDDDDGTLPFN